MDKLTAMGCFIFMGSASIGVENNGYDIKRVLEISDDIIEKNAASFVVNRPQIPVILPKEWDNEEYLSKLEEVDLLYSNCPCSGLSQLNRNASADNEKNEYMYKLAKVTKKLKPKVMLLENAPALISYGFPVLKKIIEILKDDYYFTVVRDAGKKHNVCMTRLRTFVIAWRKDVFEGVPLLNMNIKEEVSMMDIIGKYSKYELGEFDSHYLDENRDDIENEHLYKYVNNCQSIDEYICKNWNEVKISDKKRKSLINMKNKIDKGLRYFDKSHFKPALKGKASSMASTTKIIHPVLNRPLTIREYMSIMGYPDDFKYVKSLVPPCQAIGQGVPVKFFEYISGEVKEALLGNREIIKDCNIIFQNHSCKKANLLTFEQALSMDKLEIKKQNKSMNLK